MTTPSNEQTPKPRLDQRLVEETQRACRALLDQFPELRSVAIVLDYELRDAGSLPPGAWIPRRALHPLEAIQACQAADKMAMKMRNEHDRALIEIIKNDSDNSKPPVTEDKANGKAEERTR